MRIGFVVNPIAGMGGRVGLKGTDDKIEEARQRGAEPRAPERAVDALESLKGLDLELLTYGDRMGEDEVGLVGLDAVVVGEPRSEETSAEDTREAVREFVGRGVDLVVFVGGDGTAIDVLEAIEDVGVETPVLGVPAGVKVYSSVFVPKPSDTGSVVRSFAVSRRTEEREVSDIDEEAFREGVVRGEPRGVVSVPANVDLQPSKQVTGGDVEGIVRGFLDDVRDDTTYVLGPGGTLMTVKEGLGFDGTPLGVDVWRGDVVVKDAGETEILSSLGDSNVVVVSPIGGQGFIFGRGNQQISPEVIRRSEVTVIASPEKLASIDELRVDTGDKVLDEELRGWMKVRVGRNEYRLMRVR